VLIYGICPIELQSGQIHRSCGSCSFSSAWCLDASQEVFREYVRMFLQSISISLAESFRF